LKKNKFRLSFPEDEKLHNWLSMLLNSYAIMDEGVKTDIENVEKLGKNLPANVVVAVAVILTEIYLFIQLRLSEFTGM